MKTLEEIEEIGSTIIGAAIIVHSHLGPGLLESAYQKCLCYELQKQGRTVRCEVPLPIKYRGHRIEVGYRLDMIVEECVLVENKTVEKINPVHEAQLLTYLRLNEYQLGYLLNWNVALMKHGIKRMVNRL
jgi:GxxExxY protein